VLCQTHIVCFPAEAQWPRSFSSALPWFRWIPQYRPIVADVKRVMAKLKKGQQRTVHVKCPDLHFLNGMVPLDPVKTIHLLK
jgi:hypothetical protein